MSLVCIYVQEPQFVLIMSMLKFTGVLKQWCKHKLPTLNFFRPFFLLLWLLSPMDWFCLLSSFNGLFSSEGEFLHGTVIIFTCLFLMDWTAEGGVTAALSLNDQFRCSISLLFQDLYFPWMPGTCCCTNPGNQWELLFWKKRSVFPKSAAHMRCGGFILNPILMNCGFAKNGASLWEQHSQELLVVTENLNGRRFPSLAAQILAWREAFSSFYLSAERVLLCTSILLGTLSISQLSPRAGRAAQCPLLEEEEEAGWSLASPFLSGFRSRAAAHCAWHRAEHC